MVRRQASGNRGFALIVMLALAGGVLASGCGSGGGGGHDGIDGGLCAQCGDTDGPCRDTVAVSGSDAQELCTASSITGTVDNVDSSADSCTVKLMCFRKLGSSQRRCYPNDGDQASQQFRCDGERANRNTPTPTPTPKPSATPTLSATPTITVTFTPGGGQVTATPTLSATPTDTPTPDPTPTPGCGNNEIDDDEECDGTDFNPDTDCDSYCSEDQVGGTVSCNSNCTLNFSRCVDPSNCGA